MIEFKLWLFAALGAALAITGFCRAVVMDAKTHPAVRHTMAALTATGSAVALAALFAPHLLCWSLAACIAAFLAMQLVTSHLWSNGTPEPFRKP